VISDALQSGRTSRTYQMNPLSPISESLKMEAPGSSETTDYTTSPPKRHNREVAWLHGAVPLPWRYVYFASEWSSFRLGSSDFSGLTFTLHCQDGSTILVIMVTNFGLGTSLLFSFVCYFTTLSVARLYKPSKDITAHAPWIGKDLQGIDRALTEVLNSVAFIRKRTIPTERPPLVGEVSANFCG
jgi:hypothetical protein